MTKGSDLSHFIIHGNEIMLKTTVKVTLVTTINKFLTALLLNYIFSDEIKVTQGDKHVPK